jgi:hypothetical protein
VGAETTTRARTSGAESQARANSAQAAAVKSTKLAAAAKSLVSCERFRCAKLSSRGLVEEALKNRDPEKVLDAKRSFVTRRRVSRSRAVVARFCRT